MMMRAIGTEQGEKVTGCDCAGECTRSGTIQGRLPERERRRNIPPEVWAVKSSILDLYIF